MKKTTPDSFEDVQSVKTFDQTPQRLTCNEQMLLESMLDDDDRRESIHPIPSDDHLTSSKKGFLLIDANERLVIKNEKEFFQHLQCEHEDLKVKSVSILGNTGDGKSFTLNQIFFDGEQVFQTSSTADSCTMGVWAAIDDAHRTLIFDTEGRLGLTGNDNIRNRLLLKVFCLSDIVIYRTRASKLPNDMFQLLSDASQAFQKHFQSQLENIFKPSRIHGPTLVIFHETQHTGILQGKIAIVHVNDSCLN